MSLLPDADWQRLLPLVRARCPRLTPADFAECGQRSELLAAKIQNRHWVSRTTAQRLLVALRAEAGLAAAAGGGVP